MAQSTKIDITLTNNHETPALLDTGSDVSLISRRLIQTLELAAIDNEAVMVKTVGGKQLRTNRVYFPDVNMTISMAECATSTSIS